MDDLFLLARSDAGHLVVHRGPIYLEEVVDDTTRGMRPLAEKRQVRLELADVVEAPVEGDADLLGRLLLNLMDNAIKHSPPGGLVTVGMQRVGEWIHVRCGGSGSGHPRRGTGPRVRAVLSRRCGSHTTGDEPHQRSRGSVSPSPDGSPRCTMGVWSWLRLVPAIPPFVCRCH